MPTAIHGLRRAVFVIVGGIALMAILDSSSSFLSSSSLSAIKLLVMLGGIVAVLKSPYWGTGYLFGWLLGFVLLAEMGLVGLVDIIFCIGIPASVLFARVG